MSGKTAAMAILLENNSSVNLSLIKSSITGSSSQKKLELPEIIDAGSTDGGIGTKSSETPYTASWSYSPDGGETLLEFTCSLNGPTGITITPSKSGPQAPDWTTGESPRLDKGVWIVQFIYQKQA